MDMSERKKKILRAIVDSYIQTAEPVGSKAIASMPGMNFSPATIRNEMAELESMGFLEQPHTSAGRIPSPAGYRLYVDELMMDYRLSLDETQSLNQALHLKMQELDKVVSEAGKIVSRLTNYPVYALASHSGRLTVKRFELLYAETHAFIAVALMSNDVVKNKLIKLPLNCSEQDLKLLTALLNASFTDLTADQMTPELMQKVEREAGKAASLVSLVVNFAIEVLTSQQNNEVYLAGETKLLDHPEYHDVDKAQNLLATLNDESVLATLPVPDNQDPVKILIGPENVAEALKDTSVIVARYDIGEGMQGMIGVVGPTRMDYAKVAARLSYFADGMNRLFQNQLPLPEDGDEGDDLQNIPAGRDETD